MTTIIDGVEGFKSRVGEHLGYSDLLEITQDRIDKFAEATGDYQWIHVDRERAEAGPFGTTIAHGYLTLSLGPVLMEEVVTVTGMAMGVNYGMEKVRFPSPVPVGSKLRLGIKLVACDDVPGGVQVTMEFAFEVKGAPKPACVATIVFRYVAG